MLLTTGWGRGVPRDTFPAYGTGLTASSILASLLSLNIIWPGDKSSPAPQCIYGKGAKSPLYLASTYPLTCDPMQWAQIYINQQVCSTPAIKYNWKLSMTSRWAGNYDLRKAKGQWKQADEIPEFPPVPQSRGGGGRGEGDGRQLKKNQPAFFSKVLSVSVHCCL